MRLLLQGGLLCNDSELVREGDQWTITGDPTEGAFLVAAEKAGIGITDTRAQHQRIGEVPFSSERKRMTTTHRNDGAGAVAFMKGVPEAVMARCDQIAEGDTVRGLSDEERALILNNNGKMAGDALRRLALAYRELDDPTPRNEDELESEMVFLGLVEMMDPPRDEALKRSRSVSEWASVP